MNVICLGGRVMGTMVAWDLVETFLAAEFSQEERHLRRPEQSCCTRNEGGQRGRGGGFDNSSVAAQRHEFQNMPWRQS
jgi:hypothetical protein